MYLLYRFVKRYAQMEIWRFRRKNESYKIEWYREKTMLVLFKMRIEISAELNKGYILPLANNIVWDLSFERIRTNKKATRYQEWNPANCCLLTDSETMKTRVTSPTKTTYIVPFSSPTEAIIH